MYLSWQTPSFNLLTVSLQELTLTTHGDGEAVTRGLEQCDPPVVGGGVAWVLEVGSVDAGGVAAAGADCNRRRSGQASGNNVLTLELQTIYRRCFHNHQSLLGPTVSKREIWTPTQLS